MRILHLSKDDIGGGAGMAAFRLHQGLRLIGVDSWMLVASKQSDDDHVIEIPRGIGHFLNKVGGRVEDLLAKWFLEPGVHWDLSLVPAPVMKLIREMKPDAVNLHWINRGVMSVGQIPRLNVPVFWTFHDMWAATAGYHYYGDFLREELAPASGEFEENISQKTLAKKLLHNKIDSWRHCPMQVVCPSLWLQRISSQSTILSGKKVHHIPYGLDLAIYRPADKLALRKKLGLPEGKRLLLFGAASSSVDKRKGSDLLLAALKMGVGNGSLLTEDLALVVFGHQPSVEQFGELSVYSLGYLKGDHAMAEAYAAVDGFVAPSREDNLPNTVLESLASGTPVVAFRIGGMPDMIEDGVTGFLASPFSVSGLLESILKVVDLPADQYDAISQNCREKSVQMYPLERQALEYQSLYESSLK